jgi:hypothetical protein
MSISAFVPHRLKYYLEHSMADEIEDTFDKLKAGAKAVAKKVTDPGKD